MRPSFWVTLCMFLAPLGCERGGTSGGGATSATAAPIGSAECAVCNMVVREQPSPRAQVVHNDGTRAHLCSADELVQVLSAPSPHGEVKHMFIEMSDPGVDPSETSTTARPWKSAKDAWYVLGVERKAIMGPPVLAYESKSDAEKVAEKHKAEVLDFEQLRAKLLDQANAK